LDSKIKIQKNGKFLNIFLPLNKIQVIKAQKINVYFIQIEDPAEKYNIMCADEGYIGDLADLIGIGRNTFKSYIRNGEVKAINDIIQSSENAQKIVQINASNQEDDFSKFWIFAFSTERHVIVTFNQIAEIVNRMLPRIKESTFNNIKVWEMKCKTIVIPELNNEKFDLMIRVTSGRNNKSSAIKVIVYLKVYSCENSIKCLNLSSIKRTINWKTTLIDQIKTAVKLMHTVKETLQKASESITLAQGIEYIENIKLPVKLEHKKNSIRELIKKRFMYEYHKNGLKNKFALSQALSNVGTHTKPNDYITDYTLDVLQHESFNCLTI
jgi:predicted DNA binding protein